MLPTLCVTYVMHVILVDLDTCEHFSMLTGVHKSLFLLLSITLYNASSQDLYFFKILCVVPYIFVRERSNFCPEAHNLIIRACLCNYFL